MYLQSSFFCTASVNWGLGSYRIWNRYHLHWLTVNCEQIHHLFQVILPNGKEISAQISLN